MDMSQYLEIFIEESKEHLQSLNECLLELEKNPSNTDVLNEIFRVAHTLKGMSGTMGFSKMATLTHDMEDVLHALRNNEISISTKLIDLLFQCLDALENYLNCIINNGGEGTNEYKEIIAGLGNLLKGQEEVEVKNSNDNTISSKTSNDQAYATMNIELDEYDTNIIKKAIEMNLNVFKTTIVLNQGCVLKAARAFIIFQILEKHCEIIKAKPTVEDIEDEKFDYEFTVILVSKEREEILKKELGSVAEVDEIIISNIDAETINKLSLNTNEITTAEVSMIKNIDMPESPVNIKEKAAEEKGGSGAPAKSKTGKTVRVDIDRLDILMNLVSELIIIKTRLEGIDNVDKAQSYTEAVEYMERITTSLHDAVMKVRMVPVEMVFNRFPRMIRDVSKELGKEINLTMSGEETELDRTVIDEIGDPLIHILRNSADHGLESTQKRIESGKTEAGNIFLRAYQDGNNVVIEVEDDGAGINIDKVRNKIIEKGLMSEDLANNLSKKDVIDYLFKPSFSTADKITDLSGRGVGLDVVKTKIEALGGVVEVETEKGKGSKFIIRLPLTLAIIQALLVLIGEEKYAIPLNSIKEIINISPDDIKLIQKQEVILLRNMVLPIVRLDKVLEVPNTDKVKKQLTVVVVKKGDKLSGFLVDSLIGQQEIVIKSLGKLLAGIKCIAGATILGDGNVALIVDVNSLA